MHIFAISAISNELAGRHDVARKYGERILKLDPNYTKEKFFRSFQFRDEATIAAMDQALAATLR